MVAIGCLAAGCGSLGGSRAISLAASSGPSPHVEVGIVEEAEGAGVRRRLDVYDVSPEGLAPRARLDALALLGSTGRGEIGSFRAYEADDRSRVHSGLVAHGADEEGRQGAPVLLATKHGYASAQADRVIGLDAFAKQAWQLPLSPASPACSTDAMVEVDAQASPSGRWICVARTARAPAGARGKPCSASRVTLGLVEANGSARASHAFDWEAGEAGIAQCAVRDDATMLLLLPSLIAGRTRSASRLVSATGSVQALTELGGAAIDAAPVGERWAVLLHRVGEVGTTPWLVGGRAPGQRLLGNGEHALVPLPGALIVVSVALPDRGALEVHRFDARGRRLAEDRVDLD